MSKPQGKTDFPDLIKHFEFSKPEAKISIAPFIGLLVINMSYSIGLVIYFYVLYQGIVECDIYKLIATIGLWVYTSFYCKKSEFFIINYMQRLKLYQWFKSYTIYSEEEVDQEGTLFPWMPHNILSIPMILKNSLGKQNPLYNAVILGSRAALNIPLIGTFSQWGGVSAVDAKQFKNYMQKQTNMLFVPGGFEEATITSHKEYRIYADRFGFIKYALKYGYNVSPIICFNENRGYKTTDVFLNFRLFLNRFKFPACLFFSRFFILPEHNVDAVVLIGSKMKMPKIEHPTKEQVHEFHKQYIYKVRDLFEKHKSKFDPNGKMVFYSKLAEYKNL